MKALLPLFFALVFSGAAVAQGSPATAKPALAGVATNSGTTKPGTPATGTPRTITWDILVPQGWEPFKEFKDMNFQAMDDGDPKAAAMLKKMRDVWDNAPVNSAIVGQQVRIPGFVVPLEDTKDGMKEFLLVPYFGACIHSPPPPANQIVHVLPKSPAKGLRSMDAVWITGTLATVRTDSYMGAASYRIEALSVAPYSEAPK
jgi:hypothetical protein